MAAQWGDEIISRLKKLLQAGWSYRMIALELGKTRNAVCGQVHRLGLAVTKVAIKVVENPKPEPRPRKPTKLNFNNSSTASIVVEKPLTAAEIAQVSAADVPPEQRKTLFDLADSECHWPLGDPRDHDFGFCGAPRVAGPHPYCRQHMALSRPGWRG